MGKRRVPNGADELYRRHLRRTPFETNPRNNRFAVLQRMYMRVLTELAANRFKWTNLPEEIDVRFMELTLFYFGLSVFYYDLRYDKYMALRGGSSGWLNMVDNPRYFQVVGNNFVGRIISAAEDGKDARKAIPIWANYLRMPDLDIVEIYASKLAEIDRTIEINSKNARQTKFLRASENQRLSIVNINRQIDEGQDYVQVNGSLPQEAISVEALDLGIDKDLLMSLHILRTRLWSECMGLLGIDNSNQDKKERLVAAEVSANDEQTSMHRYVNLNARRTAAEKINDYYGLNIKVEYWTDKQRNISMMGEGGFPFDDYTEELPIDIDGHNMKERAE